MIIRAGENISPQEIEQVIRQLKWVCSVKVIGIPAEVLQEEIAACIVPVPGCQVDKEGLLRYLKPRLAHYKIPAYVLTFDKFPLLWWWITARLAAKFPHEKPTTFHYICLFLLRKLRGCRKQTYTCCYAVQLMLDMYLVKNFLLVPGPTCNPYLRAVRPRLC